uniref:Uncharacterized protein n=2 Tax=viral metagenome TaxID=1070528 RepID=A0A6H1ZPA1_9ZZZZ
MNKMASKNILLGSGNVEEVVVKPPEIQKYAPVWRFHKSCLKGKLVVTDRELVILDEQGWKDHPGKVQLLPGHEHLFEG